MTKLKGILLTQGMHGMISQVEGLAKALDIDFVHHIVELNNFWKMIPPKLTPISGSVYKKVEHSGFDVIISCAEIHKLSGFTVRFTMQNFGDSPLDTEVVSVNHSG